MRCSQAWGLAPAALAACFLAACAGQITGAGGDPAGDLAGADGGDGASADAAVDPAGGADAARGSDAAIVPPSGRYHPAGFADPDVHGAELKLQVQDCRGCHGATLEGQSPAPSCDSCHSASAPTAWRTTCTFCHGGSDDSTGAPPRHLDGTAAGAGVFAPHPRHVTTTLAAPIDCRECHVKPDDVLSPGHAFDTTPAVAEVTFAGGRSALGRFDATARACANLYCHGNGRGDNGQVEVNAAPMTCTSCHAGLASGSAGWSTMSGKHRLHLGLGGITCGDCHRGVTSDGVGIADASLHVNGARDLAFSAAGFAFDAAAQRCSGDCHGEGHGNRSW
jgi:predicted CxxxxCH...CXXCH cytochrome family protein